MKVQNIERLHRTFIELNKRNKARFEKGLIKAALLLQRASQEIVPVDTGALKNSAFTKVLGWKNGLFSVQTGYRGVDYAIYVHEIPPYPYITLAGQQRSGVQHDPPTQWKFLETPARLLHKEMANVIKRELLSGGRRP